MYAYNMLWGDDVIYLAMRTDQGEMPRSALGVVAPAYSEVAKGLGQHFTCQALDTRLEHY